MLRYCFLISVALLFFSCQKEGKGTLYYAECHSEKEIALHQLDFNDTLMSGYMIWVYTKDSMRLKGTRNAESMAWNAIDAGDSVQFKYAIPKMGTDTLNGTRFSEMLDESDKVTFIPLSKKSFDEKIAALYAPVKLITRNKTLSYGDYVFEVTINDYNDETFEGNTTVVVKDKATGREIQSIDSSNFLFNAHIDFTFADYNFDGYDDISFYNGRNGSYMTDTYDYYLFDPKAGKFIFNEELTDIATQVGIEFDEKKKLVYVFGKSGCCWHITQMYKPEGNKFSEIRRLTIAEDTKVEVKIEHKKNGRWIKSEKTFRTFDDYRKSGFENNFW